MTLQHELDWLLCVKVENGTRANTVSKAKIAEGGLCVETHDVTEVVHAAKGAENYHLYDREEREDSKDVHEPDLQEKVVLDAGSVGNERILFDSIFLILLLFLCLHSSEPIVVIFITI